MPSNGQRYVTVAGNGFPTVVARVFAIASNGDVPFIPLGVLLMVDLQTLITTKVYIISRSSNH